MKTEIADTSILIYGAGAVGLGIASCLLKAGAKLDILARPDTADSLRRHGLVRTGIFGKYTADPSRMAILNHMPRVTDWTEHLAGVEGTSKDRLAVKKSVRRCCTERIPKV
jgi:2-dehydropantoate 2-reductase